MQADDRALIPAPSVLKFPHHITDPVLSLPGHLFFSHDTNPKIERTMVGTRVPYL